MRVECCTDFNVSDLSLICRGVEFAIEASLTLAEYLDWAHQPRIPSRTSTRRRADRALAAYINPSTGKHILVKWKDHAVPTWRVDDGSIKHKLLCADLTTDVTDDSHEFQVAIGPEAYAMCGGILHPLLCCRKCTESDDRQLGLDYRLYVDASRRGNVSGLLSLLLYSLNFFSSLRA